MKTKREKLIKKIGGQEELEKRAQNLLDREVFFLAGDLVEFVQKKDVYPEWENMDTYENRDLEIVQYWCISQWLYERMHDYNIGIIAYIDEINMCFWARTTSQGILETGELQDVILAIEEQFG